MAHSTALRTTAALIVLASSTVQTVAGGYARECYRQVHAAPVYETVYEKVLVEPGRKHVEVIPAVYGTERRRVLVRAAETRWRIVPAEYATVKEKVLVEPARTVERIIPAVTKTVHRKVKVHDGGYAWEWRWIKGEKVLCKVKRHAVYKTVAETVVVRDQRVTYETIPARYGYEHRRVQVRAESRERVVVPAEYDYVTERVLIEPARKTVHRSEPRYEVVAKRVLVREGRTGWERVRRHCRG